MADDSKTVPLPHSGIEPYGEKYWDEVVSNLKPLKSNKTLETLEKGILHFFNKTRFDNDKCRWVAVKNTKADDHDDDGPMTKLASFRTVFSTLAEEKAEFLEDVLPFLVDLALEMPELFPTGRLKKLHTGEAAIVSLSIKQVACLLTHMFFCTLLPVPYESGQPDGHYKGVPAPTGPLTFREWLQRSYLPPCKIYLQILIRYFIKIYKEGFNGAPLTFERVVLTDSNKPDWKSSESKIIPVNLKLHGRISDDEGEIELDFANENVGHGSTGTQEELIFGMSPELCPIVLFNDTLAANESNLMSGGRKIADYSGYGMRVKYTGLVENEWDWSKRTIVAIDAICQPDNQLGDHDLLRELNKAYCGFSGAMNDPKGTRDTSWPIATGHWGCGAFGGDMSIKAFLQVMAASEAKCSNLNFYCFGEQEFKFKFEQALHIVQQKGLLVKDLWAMLKKASRATTASYMSSFIRILKGM